MFAHDVTFQVMRGAGVQLGCCILSAISVFRGFMVRMPLHPAFNLSSTVLLLLTKWGNSLFLPIVMVMCIVTGCSIVLAEILMYCFITYQKLSLAKDSRRNSSANDTEKVI